ncbi:MAG: hypothetical protein ACD_49C00083G0004 [uncultured bacterium (gcode 4)]|uniref:DUF4325 domain-containing protein n=1 Tax=uncultured bacterium (gcode 4) TaxID=1234023 RepID=K2AVB9_9BACT|nr:MAG: hypothetical protein ACD_49C00083G0004 [uncultured bacterium (gcode 4)]
MENLKLNIATEYTKTLWARYISDWEYSWEDFYKKILENSYKESLKEWKKLEINFDWTLWAPSSFLSESFWRLYKNHWKEKIWENLIIVSSDDLSLKGVIKKLAEKYE